MSDVDYPSLTAKLAREKGLSYGRYVAQCGTAKRPKPEPVPVDIRICKECGRKFEYHGGKRIRLYCSEECRYAAALRQRKEHDDR